MIDELGARAAELPVQGIIARLRDAVAATGTAVVQAAPGSGKTTLVAPALASGGQAGRVVVTQPRRIAARAAAQRLADLLGETVGQRVGYSVRGERRVGRATMVEFVTTGVLLRRLQGDAELPGISCVVLDEVHERQLEGDLLLAFLIDVRNHLRPDLGLVAMSATIEGRRTAALLGSGTPVLHVPVAQHPVEIKWRPARHQRLVDRGVAPEFLDHVARVIREALAKHPGDVIAFVPGVAEVNRLCRTLGDVSAEVLPLHGRLSPAAQDAVLRGGQQRRVVVATAVAESSLTVPGVGIVVDAGLSREPHTDHRRGLPGLVTRYASQAAAEQRAGRAGRLGPGVAYRCWSQAEHAGLARHPAPEITTADLTAFLLELRRWGSDDGADLTFVDEPPATAMAAAAETLAQLGLSQGQKLTALGRQVADLGLDPRLGRALVGALPHFDHRVVIELIALLSAGIATPGADIVAALRAVRRGDDAPARAWSREVNRLRGVVRRITHPHPDTGPPGSDDAAAGFVVAAAHPQRIARLREDGSSYLMAQGTAAVLPRGSSLVGAPWLAIVEVDRQPGRGEAIIRAAAVLDEATALQAGTSLRQTREEISWLDGRLRARRVETLGAIELTSTPMADPPAEGVVDALLAALSRDGINSLPWGDTATSLRQRLAFLHRHLGEPWPDVSAEALWQRREEWLVPSLRQHRGLQDLRELDLTAALRALLPWPAAARLDDLAPSEIQVPSGSRRAVNYADPMRPVLAVRIQEVFGWPDTPRLADGRVPVVVELLSPANRPAAVTSDLAGFWAGGYHEVRRELRGRYPKHSWPADPATAPAIRGVARRR